MARLELVFGVAMMSMRVVQWRCVVKVRLGGKS